MFVYLRHVSLYSPSRRSIYSSSVVSVGISSVERQLIRHLIAHIRLCWFDADDLDRWKWSQSFCPLANRWFHSEERSMIFPHYSVVLGRWTLPFLLSRIDAVCQAMAKASWGGFILFCSFKYLIENRLRRSLSGHVSVSLDVNMSIYRATLIICSHYLALGTFYVYSVSLADQTTRIIVRCGCV